MMNERKTEEDNKIANGLNDFLSQNRFDELLYSKHQDGENDVVEEAFDRYFEEQPSNREAALMDEFLGDELKRAQRDTVDAERQFVEYEEEALEPEELNPEWLTWQTPRHKNLISQMITGKASKWEILNEIGDQFYHLRKDVRAVYKTGLQNYCIKNIKNVIGEEHFNVLRGMYLDTDPIDQMETKFHELVAELPEERERLLADHYAVFCRKIFRLVHFEPTDLTTWLTTPQKNGSRRNDSKSRCEGYANLRQEATGEQKDEATDIIETGCRHFIAHMFGDDNAEELEELREAGVKSKQYLAARLATHISEVSDTVDRKRAEGSLSICSRIYLAYDGSCDCNGHSSICDSLRHYCVNCTDNTYGVQCEMCMESFTGNPLNGGECTPIELEETSCTCNNHSDICDTEGKCQSCLHNTVGDHCERCAAGFHGDATTGTPDDCTRCPCPDGGDCFINEQDLVQCRECPIGKHGIICEEDGMTQKDKDKETTKDRETRKKLKHSDVKDERTNNTESNEEFTSVINQNMSRSCKVFKYHTGNVQLAVSTTVNNPMNAGSAKI
ncbi:laminin EGF-like protein [Dictyocaulus viviparus]|uniref:Laminin EGF-like protein n=1 Tax=Dictyocaulus viviparus TaxID=29172 RepID=A0A0D8XUP3_DICVI|nr:laminin EGF-like protein [Dictyocaulus viviparus]